MNELDIKFMRAALKEAQKAYLHDEVPIGAVLVKDG
jgi:tRNA(Arg) A34 adenosine deaminase TadA